MSSSKALFPPQGRMRAYTGNPAERKGCFSPAAVPRILTNVEEFSAFPWSARRLYAMFGGLNFQR